jgi:signal transduction histidine kinase
MMTTTAHPLPVPGTAADADADARAHLRGPWLLLARALWLAGLAASVTLYASAMSRNTDLRVLHFDRSPLLAEAWLIGIPWEWLELINSASMVAVYLAFPALSYAVGLLIFWRRSRDWMALLVALMLVTSVPFLTLLFYKVDEQVPLIWWARDFDMAVAFAAILFVPYLFPDGRFVPRWGWLAPTCGFVVVAAALTLDGLSSDVLVPTWLEHLQILPAVGVLVIGAASQVYRYRRLSTAAQRQQTRWILLGLCLSLPLLFASIYTESLAWGGWGGTQALPLAFRRVKAALDLIAYPALLLLPLTIGLAALRSRLWDLDPLVNRTLVWGALTALVVAAYALVVGALGLLSQTSGNTTIALLATGLIAVAFQPARERLQRAVNRLMYGERDDPYAVLARLGQRLETSLAPEAALPTIVRTVREALKLPYAAITVPRALPERPGGDQGAAPPAEEVVAAVGAPTPDPVALSLTYGAEPVGRLLLARRSADEPFSRADRRLLDDVARLASLALHAARLTTDLQRSRARLVTAREEERRRLRRDLHDGLGAELAALNLQVGALRPLILRDPAAGAARVPELQDEIRAAIGDIRRLVYGLRPPALDELGLVGALRARAGQYAAGDTGGAAAADDAAGVRVAVEAPAALPPLPAAVEVAAYWIVQEALTNVVKHARARAATVRLALADGALAVEVVDDGAGLAAGAPIGVGLRSMRERAEELGGACTIEPGPAGGARVVARLPLPREE